MTEVEFCRDEAGQMLRAEGHQDRDIWCAGVSSIMSGLITAVQMERLNTEWRVADGIAEFKAARSERIDAMFDMAVRAYEAMAEKWPERVRIVQG